MFISSSNRIFSLTVQDVPARVVMPMVREGLKRLARLPAEAWEMMGPISTARDYLYGLATPSISAGQETMPQANAKSLMKIKGGCDDMDGAPGSDDEFRLNKVRKIHSFSPSAHYKPSGTLCTTFAKLPERSKEGASGDMLDASKVKRHEKDPFDLRNRFVLKQKEDFACALSEIKAGRKKRCIF